MAGDRAHMDRLTYRELKFEYDRTSGKYLVDPESIRNMPVCHWHGLQIVIDDKLPANTIEFRAADGHLLGTIVNVTV